MTTTPNPAVIEVAQFLCERLREFERDLTEPSETNDYFGHVQPALSRLEAALSASQAEPVGWMCLRKYRTGGDWVTYFPEAPIYESWDWIKDVRPIYTAPQAVGDERAVIVRASSARENCIAARNFLVIDGLEHAARHLKQAIGKLTIGRIEHL